MKVKEIVSWLNEYAPFSQQESYDNSGLQTGDPEWEVISILLCIDITEEVIVEALHLNSNLIISHHPVIFNELKSLTGKTFTERIIIEAIRNNIAIISSHTNIDIAYNGVSAKMCEKLQLQNIKILNPVKDFLLKLVFFVPVDHADKVREKIFAEGAGYIGNYDMCSFNVEGTGTFRASENAKPFIGKKGEIHFEKEIRVETILPAFLQNKIISALIQTHPYEEVAYDIYPLKNIYNKAGSGMIGDLLTPIDEYEFLLQLKQVFNCSSLRHTNLLNKKIKKVALCGGSGSFLLPDAIAAGADIFISGDFKYHQFFSAEKKIIIADLGHYESEQFTKELFYEILAKKIPTFAIHLSEVKTNPINYL